MPLTDLIIQGAEPAAKPIKFFDAAGLCLEVPPSGVRWWRPKCQFAVNGRRLPIGTYPHVSLKENRIRRAAAKIQFFKGSNTSAAGQAIIHKQGINTENNFEKLGPDWCVQWRYPRAAGHTTHVVRRRDVDLFSPFGTRPIASITTVEIVPVVKKKHARGALYIAKRTLHSTGEIYRFAVGNEQIECNLIAKMKPADALTPSIKRHIVRVTGNELPKLQRKTAVAYMRTIELINIRGESFEFKSNISIWRNPAARTKIRHSPIIPLARLMVPFLDQRRKFMGNGDFLSHGDRNACQFISNNALLVANYRTGYSPRVTGNGFRGFALAFLQDQHYKHKYNEFQIGHQDKRRCFNVRCSERWNSLPLKSGGSTRR
ncbi:tyrosine-type recombinase/integrase [Pseudomonas bohemica]|uniref:tyrosine-type recombinase/integrase n=1 Tax=Pseudomonas bohemica TaxID=2044872 RepID=UPI000DA5FABA|nr:integrase arm-type DNA-binding domain-containing protein [Pseudomonas bohemica]